MDLSSNDFDLRSRDREKRSKHPSAPKAKSDKYAYFRSSYYESRRSPSIETLPGTRALKLIEKLSSLEPTEQRPCSSEPAPFVCPSSRKRRAESSLSITSSASQSSSEAMETPPPSERAATPVPEEEVDPDWRADKESAEGALMECSTEVVEYLERPEKAFSEKATVRDEHFVRVIRGLSMKSSPVAALEDLQRQGVNVLSCFRMKSRRTKGFLPLLQVEIRGSPKCVVGITRILGEAVTIEILKRADDTICYRCCRFGHTSRTCGEPRQRCMRCGEDHRLRECPQPRSKDVVCITCNSPGHLAAWRACELHPRHRSKPAAKPRPSAAEESQVPEGGSKPRPQEPRTNQSQRRTSERRPPVTQSSRTLRLEMTAMQDFFKEIRATFKDIGGFTSILTQFRKLETRTDRLSYLLSLVQE